MQKHVFMFRYDTAVEYAYIKYDDTSTDSDGRNEQVDSQVEWVLNALQSTDTSVYAGLRPLGSSRVYTIARKHNIGYITLIELDPEFRVENVSCYPNEQRKWQRELAQSVEDGHFAIDNMIRVK